MNEQINKSLTFGQSSSVGVAYQQLCAVFRQRVVVQQKSTRHRKWLIATGYDVIAAPDSNVDGARVDKALNVLLDARLYQVCRA